MVSGPVVSGPVPSGPVFGHLLAGFAAYQLLGQDDADGGSGVRAAAPPPPSATVPMPSYPAALRRFYEQRLDWRGCAAYECALLTVPLDYAEPDGRTIRLAVLHVPATQRGEVGQLVVDPGGPGVPAVQYAAAGAQAAIGFVAWFGCDCLAPYLGRRLGDPATGRRARARAAAASKPRFSFFEISLIAPTRLFPFARGYAAPPFVADEIPGAQRPHSHAQRRSSPHSSRACCWRSPPWR